MAYYDQVTNRDGNAVGSGGVDLRQKSRRAGFFAPVESAASYLRSSEFQDWANPEEEALTQGVDSIYSGARTAQREATNNAQRLGLGRGAAAQFRTDIQQNASSLISNATLSAKLLGGERRAQGAMLLMEALREAQAAKALARMQHRAGGLASLFQGNLAAGLGSSFGGLPGDAVQGSFDILAGAQSAGSGAGQEGARAASGASGGGGGFSGGGGGGGF